MNLSITYSAQNAVPFTVESGAFEGVKRIAQKAAVDFERVCGTRPAIIEQPQMGLPSGTDAIIFATLGKSPLVDKLVQEGRFDASAIRGKREVYQIRLLEKPFDGVQKALLVCGSDKRGTIYGIFSLSEYIGVSPLHFWGDVEPVARDTIEIKSDIETISKEPSVKYRGVFINDEWPCFGNWTVSHFGGFTAEMYDHVFELLLRLKGNYLWPAMWTSSFPLDGPGSLNEELADIYGVVMGASHHEPCLRASEEWDKVRGPDSIYGNDWNYHKNKNGLLKYWEDALKRSGQYEKLITIGMRGERDSSMLGAASLKENIDQLKDIIKNQRELIKKHVNADTEKTPQVLAIYKEVEEYFYGDQNTEGLKNWDGLDGVIYMFCEDNFGFMRSLPDKNLRNRKGGFGMYYHFDYHGGPVSYEWMPSISYERTWEQMSMAYDYGIKDAWIVNVGDLKFNEVPLAYFMELAYDFEKWGSNAPNSVESYTALWLEKTFPSVNAQTREKISCILHEYIRINSMRRPEALNACIYHPCHYLEADRMIAAANKIEALNEEVYSALSAKEREAFYSMIYFPAKISVNLLRMHIYAGKNRHFADQGKTIANAYAALVTECIEKDRALAGEFAQFKNGKWKGMELEQHIGFVKWNEDNSRYPQRIQVEPAYKPRMTVSRKDGERVYTKNYGNPMIVEVHDFLYAGNEKVIIEIANDGINSLEYTIEPDEQYDWLEINSVVNMRSISGSVKAQEEIIISCNRDKLANKKPTGSIQSARLLIGDKETAVAVEVKARTIDTSSLPPMTFLENNGVIAMEANHFYARKDTGAAHFIELKNYGRSGAGMKAFPTLCDFNEKDDKPSLSYRFVIEEAGTYAAELWTTPTNSVQNKRPLRFMLTSNGGNQIITAVPQDFIAGSPSDERWCIGVLDNIRINKTALRFDKGIQEISISPLEAGLILERILVYKEGCEPLPSYLGPTESYFTPPS